ncbi:uncharacterized protein LOC105763314 isoform X1 [Gossypium raimondii]|uniref:uncharacterized protein LOC105763314 isoform X1 n=1 Tax=Gossypium raimondii TaxID=29730 RepID=UPI00227AB576|nr:uncharacterized protein LOC105763314 isoform X1 [Gossypium raimondii]
MRRLRVAMAVLKSCFVQVLSIDSWCLILSHSSFSVKQRVEEDGLDDSLEESNRIKLDMRHLKNSVKTPKKQSSTPHTEVQSSLKQEILQLEKRLQDQFEIRRAVETALGYQISSHEHTNETPVSISKATTELIKEIAVLELEVVYLEQYLLSLYRKAFDQQVSSISPAKRDERLKTPIHTPSVRDERLKTPVTTPSKKDERLKTPVHTPSGRFLEVPRLDDDASKVDNSAVRSGYNENSWKEPIDIVGEKLLDSGVNRCYSTLSQRSKFPSWTSPLDETLADKAVRACHSQPLSMMEYAQNASNIISLAEHLGTCISDHAPDTPNKLSEDMIKCMSVIYCKLTDPPLIQNSFSSPISSVSSASAFSPQEQHDMWSPGLRNNSSFDVRLDNPFHVEGLKEFSGPYSTMLEVPWIFRDSEKLAEVENLLQNFRSLICKLEEVDPRKLRHEEKLAFWINIHNSLVMHAFLAYGIPQNNVKRFFLLLRAAYNIGGHTISADTIQSSILGCRMPRPGQWLRLLISARTKFKAGDRRQAYAIEHPEPLLHFALGSGNHSDPAVRAYTPKNVIQELETAKQEYIRATFGVRKDLKILLPKLLESFAKDSSLCQAGIIEMVRQSLPESLRRSIRKCQVGKSRKSIEWSPHDFTFRYLISKELVK